MTLIKVKIGRSLHHLPLSHSLAAEMPPLCSSSPVSAEPRLGSWKFLDLKEGAAEREREREGKERACRPRSRPRNEERRERGGTLLKRTDTNGFPLLPRAALFELPSFAPYSVGISKVLGGYLGCRKGSGEKISSSQQRRVRPTSQLYLSFSSFPLWHPR